MPEAILEMVQKRGLKMSDVCYHTIRVLENNGKIRALVVKGETTAHIEYVCPKCGQYAYVTQPWGKVAKGVKIRFSVKCSKCGTNIDVAKLKGGKKDKKNK